MAAGEVSRLRGLRLSKPNPSDRRYPDGRDEPSATAHDGGHDGPQSVAGDATILYSCGREVQPFLWSFAGPSRAGGRAGLSGASRIERDLVAGAEPGRLRAALLLRRDARPR